MNGPGIPWYLAISAILFSTGIAGVLLRRSPLIVLLSLEIMLNASNLAFVGFSRLFGQMDGQVFALYLGLYAAGKFALTFLRTETVWFWGLQEAQLLALGALVAAIGWAAWGIWRRPAARPVPLGH